MPMARSPKSSASADIELEDGDSVTRCIHVIRNGTSASGGTERHEPRRPVGGPFGFLRTLLPITPLPGMLPFTESRARYIEIVTAMSDCGMRYLATGAAAKGATRVALRGCGEHDLRPWTCRAMESETEPDAYHCSSAWRRAVIPAVSERDAVLPRSLDGTLSDHSARSGQGLTYSGRLLPILARTTGQAACQCNLQLR